jgi:hypothetical protein
VAVSRGWAAATSFSPADCLRLEIHGEIGRRSQRSAGDSSHLEVFVASEVASLLSRVEMIFRFLERAAGRSDEFREIPWKKPAEAFGNVPRRRRCRPPNLTAEFEVVSGWLRGNHCNNSSFKFPGELPTNEIFEAASDHVWNGSTLHAILRGATNREPEP